MAKIFVLIIFVVEYTVQRLLRLVRGKRIYNENSVKGKAVIITGCNSGIGKAAALEMAKREAIVIMACRNLIEGQKALDYIRSQTTNGKLELMKLDLGDMNSIKSFASTVQLQYREIHILINNAGLLNRAGTKSKTVDGFEEHIGVNHLGHFLLTNLLLDSLKKGSPSRVVTVASTAQLFSEFNVDDLMMENVTSFGIGNRIPYNNSKYANSLFAYQLGKKLEGTGVTSYSICPGIVNSGFFRGLPWYEKLLTNIFLLFLGLSPEQGAETILYCALAKELLGKETGKFYSFCTPNARVNKRLKDDLATKLWAASEELVKSRV